MVFSVLSQFSVVCCILEPEVVSSRLVALDRPLLHGCVQLLLDSVQP